jgi:hypothetical protein
LSAPIGHEEEPPMFARIVLALDGLAFLAFGLVSLFSPETIADPVDYILSTLVAFTEFRAFYGGYEIGTGIFLLLCVAKRAWLPVGLTAAVLMIGCTALGRIYGLVSDGEPARVLLIVLALEITGTLLSLVALRSLFAPAPDAAPLAP